MASKVELRNLLEEVAANYSVKKDFNLLTGLWHKMFNAVPIELVIVAVTKHMTESEYFPSVADVWKFLDINYDEQYAWDVAHNYSMEMKSYTNVGAGLSVRQNQSAPTLVDDEVIKSTLDVISWQAIAYAEPRNLPFVRKEFLEVFDEQAKKQNVQRRAAIIEGDSSQLALKPAYDAAQAKRDAILRGGSPKELEEPQIEAEDVYSEENDLDILDGKKITSANDIF